MTSRIPPSRRSPDFAAQRAAKELSRQVPGAGRVIGVSRPGVSAAVAAAIRGRASTAGEGAGGGGDTFKRDTFTLAGGAETVALTFTPKADSAHVYLEQYYQQEGVDYTLGGNLLNIQTAMGSASGDVLEVRYAVGGAALDFPAAVMALLPDAWWRFGSTITDDSSGNGHTLTASGTTPAVAGSLTSDLTDGARTWVDPGEGPAGYSLYCPTPNGWANSTDVTVLAAIDPAAGGGVILNRDDDFGHRTFQLRIDTTGSGELAVDGWDNSSGLHTYTTSGAALIGGGRVLVGVRFQSGSVDLLVNGAIDTHSPFSGGLYTGANQNIVIGKHVASDPPTDGYNHFNGVLDDIMYFTRALSDAEVASVVVAGGF